MTDVEMRVSNQAEDEEIVRKKRLHVYKSILKYYQGRSLSLDVILASKQPNIEISPHMKTYEELQKNVKGLHDDISLIKSLQDCAKLMTNSLTCSELTTLNNFNLKGSILHKIEGIIYFSKSIMKLYNEKYSELELIEKKIMYSAELSEYGKNLEESEKQQNLQNENEQSKEKAELQVYKINLIRAMKAILIGFISVNYPEILPQIQQFRTPMRRNLNVYDFSEVWDLGLVS